MGSFRSLLISRLGQQSDRDLNCAKTIATSTNRRPRRTNTRKRTREGRKDREEQYACVFPVFVFFFAFLFRHFKPFVISGLSSFQALSHFKPFIISGYSCISLTFLHLLLLFLLWVGAGQRTMLYLRAIPS